MTSKSVKTTRRWLSLVLCNFLARIRVDRVRYLATRSPEPWSVWFHMRTLQSILWPRRLIKSLHCSAVWYKKIWSITDNIQIFIWWTCEWSQYLVRFPAWTLWWTFCIAMDIIVRDEKKHEQISLAAQSTIYPDRKLVSHGRLLWTSF